MLALKKRQKWIREAGARRKQLGGCSAEKKNTIKSLLKLQFSFFLLTLLCHDAHNVQQGADEARQGENERQVVGRKTFVDKSHDLVPLNCHDVPARLVSHLR